MTVETHTPPSPLEPRRMYLLMQILEKGDAFIYKCFAEPVAGIFLRRKGISTLVSRIEKHEIDALVSGGHIEECLRSERGVRYKARLIVSASKTRTQSPVTAADRRKAKFLQAEKFFKVTDDGPARPLTVNAGESPLGWLSRRRDAQGQPFLSPQEVEAGERLRADFEAAQLGPSVTQDWRRFLSAGATKGSTLSPQDKTPGEGAEAARRRVMEALKALGPGLSDAVLRTCCFLEGLETVEQTMSWSARSAKVVLKIGLQRLALHYDTIHAAPKYGEIRTLQAPSP